MIILVLLVVALLFLAVLLVQLDRLLTLVQALAEAGQFKGGSLMFIVKADNPDVGYSITPPSVTDSEGNAVPASDLTFKVESDNSGAVAVTPDSADQLKGSVHFGSPNADGTPAIANLTVGVFNAGGTMLGSFGSQFTVTVGDPAAIVGGSITFEGLTES